MLAEKQVPAEEVLFVGNDITDLVVFPEVGYAVAPVDAHLDVIRQADLVLSKKGGKGAVRELCDMILSRYKSAG